MLTESSNINSDITLLPEEVKHKKLLRERIWRWYHGSDMNLKIAHENLVRDFIVYSIVLNVSFPRYCQLVKYFGLSKK